MTRLFAIIGLFASLAILFAAYSETPEAASAGVPAAEALAEGCIVREVALDEGYGVTRMEKQLDCPARKQARP